MKFSPTALLLSLSTLGGCALTQQPATVMNSTVQQASSFTADESSVSSAHEAPQGSAMHTPAMVQPPRTQPAVPNTAMKPLALNDLVGIARSVTKSPTSGKKYAGDTLMGQGKFIKAPKGNPNAVVADVRVAGLGEVSLWCRNVLGAAPAGKVVSFEGVLTGSVYTSEDFSHDVTMKDCRFRE